MCEKHLKEKGIVNKMKCIFTCQSSNVTQPAVFSVCGISAPNGLI